MPGSRNSTKTIGALARQTGCQVETIRYYERIGLLPAPSRSHSGYRLYDERHAERLTFVRHCRSLDMTLAEIRMLLHFRDAPEEDCGAVNRVLDDHIRHVQERIACLGKLETQLRELRGLCGTSRSARDCAILHELSHAATDVRDDCPACSNKVR
ncbi:MAG: Cd(II)/Pb(II)-responsive transcriptional regulator [Polyangiaceae bacterium]|jgi:Cd(II)/Pb(II)-responsive transcriptional regulator|nr:Cd(II)/Pb(II)-responsive transcriptional regulator [Polyangiaceae bacterium]